MRTTITQVKQLILSTGEIKVVQIPKPMALTIVEWMASLNNNPHAYGVVYYLDDSCIKVN